MMLFYRPLYVLRNSFFYAYGLVFYLFTYAPISLFQAAMGLVGFLIAYDGVYFFNDYTDWKRDLVDRERGSFKPAVKGTMKQEQCLERSVLNFVIGLPLCFFVSLPFGLMVSFAVFLNVLYSHPSIRLKDTRLAPPVMLAMQLFKYSSGWFVFTTTFKGFPFWLMLSISSVYTLVYFLRKYSDRLKDFAHEHTLTLIFTSVIGAASFVISIFVYPFKLPLILVFMIVVLVTVSFRFIPANRRLAADVPINMLIPLFIMLLLAGSAYADLNSQVCAPIENLKNNISDNIPPEIKDTVEVLENCTPKDLNEITDLLNPEFRQLQGGFGLLSLPFRAY